MQDGRFSTIRFNEWICVTAQYEKAVARIGRQVYQGFSRGLIEDFTSLEMCREVSDTFAEARELRAELEEELERDALDGLNVEEAKVADEHRTLNQAQKTKRDLKLKFTKMMGRQSVNRALAAHRDRVKELSRDLGLRALAVHKDAPVLKVRGHRALCQLAERLNDDADKKWQDIVSGNKAGVGGLSFHTILIQFVANFANFSKGTALGRYLLKFFKYDEVEENEKLSKQYEGSTTAEALKAQMEEIEEPHLDVGREIDNMQQEYEETPMEWNLPGSEDTDTDDFAHSSQDFESAPVEKWEPEADTWNPDAGVDDDFLDVVADAPDFPETPAAPPETEAAPPPPAAGPTLLRRRPEPEAESWTDTNATPPPAAKLPQVGMTAPSQTNANQEDDWGWGEESNENSDPWAETPEAENDFAPTSKPKTDLDPFASSQESESRTDPFAADPFASSDTDQSEPDPFAQYQDDPVSAQPPQAAPPQRVEPAAFSSDDHWSTPGAGDLQESPERKRPPFQKQTSPLPESPAEAASTASAPTTPPFVKAKPKETPLGDWNPEDSFEKAKSKPAKSAPTSSWGVADDEADYGWGTPAASGTTPEPNLPDFDSATPETPEADKEDPDIFSASPAEAPPLDLSIPTPAEPLSSNPGVPGPPASPVSGSSLESDDPLLRLLPPEDHTKPVEQSLTTGEESLGDDLLPAFLRERNEDDGPADSSFIPELPSFLASDDGPELEIVPFGSKSQDAAPAAETEEEEKAEPFIPELPDL